ncbi:MAG: hypothetical protein KDE47_32305, partial [Caldilineaceae bacterium]|nr:hypothetical protein [Caldilineaceae bacterium]
DKLLHAFAWALIAGTMGDVDEATAARERGIALARSAAEEPGLGIEFGAISDQNFILATHLGWQAASLIEQGELAQATPVATESLERAQTQGDPWGIADGYDLLGRLALLQGDLAQAQRLFHKAVIHVTTCNLFHMQCAHQPLLGIVTLYGGNASEARRLLTESLQLSLQLDERSFLAQTYIYLAEVALWEGAIDQAAQWLAQSLAEGAKSARITFEKVQRVWVAARLATAQQQYPHAATLFGLAEQLHSQIHHCIGGPMRARADAALAMVQAALEPAAFAEAFAAGREMVLEGAFAVIRETS